MIWIRQLRNLSQADVGAGAGVGRQTVNTAESGRTGTSIATLARIAGYYGVPIGFFLGDEISAELLREDAARRRG